MTEQDDDFDISKWPTISAEELAASRREAIRKRLAARPKDWLHDLIIAMQDVFQSQSVDDALHASERERAEAKLETLRSQAPALIHILEGLPSASRDGAFSIMFNLLAAVRGPIASDRAQLEDQSLDALEAAVQTKIDEISPASNLIADDEVKKFQCDQAARAREGKKPHLIPVWAVAEKHAHLTWSKAKPSMDLETDAKGIDRVTRSVFHRIRKSKQVPI